MKSRFGIKVIFLCTIFAFFGCQRNSTTSSTVTFNGFVFSGHKDMASGLAVADAPLANAAVTCSNFPGSSKTASDGSFSLNVETVRVFSGQNSDTFTLQASANGKDEKITATGKPGDTIRVKDFVLYQHTEE